MEATLAKLHGMLAEAQKLGEREPDPWDYLSNSGSFAMGHDPLSVSKTDRLASSTLRRAQKRKALAKYGPSRPNV
jgi:hypothetical protein